LRTDKRFAMPKTTSARIQDHFTGLTDPRRREVTYPLINIVTIAICAVICGADDFVAIAKFGRAKRKWLSRFLDLTNGIPSHDRFNAVLAAIKPAEFEACLLSWITALHEITEGELVAIDGKTLRRSFDAASSKSAIHMVSAWATANHISLGQVVVDEKSNEITAIPKLLKMLEIKGSLVTIDAMGCQTEIAETIIDADADYVLAVKDNQKTLHKGISWFFLTKREQEFARVRVSHHETHEKGHGREETRQYFVCAIPCDLPDRKRWPKLAAIGWIISTTLRDGRPCHDMRYYIMSRKLSAVSVHTPGRSEGAGWWARWERTAAVRYSKALRRCWRQVSMTVSIVSTKRLPPALCVPKESLRQITA